MGKLGRPPLDDMVKLTVSVPQELMDALDQLVAVGGYSKSSYVRLALLDHLINVGAVWPDLATTIQAERVRSKYRLENHRAPIS